jgi:hypothetical protein
MQLGCEMNLVVRGLVLRDGVKAVLATVDVGQGVRLMLRLRHMAATTNMGGTHALAAKSKVYHRWWIVVSSSPKMIHLFALQLVLDTLPVWSVTDKR